MGYQESKELQYCHKCDGKTVATYRCMYKENLKTDIRNIDPKTGKPNGDVTRAPKELPELLPHWVGQCGNRIKYTACDQCITDKLKPYFIHYPNGWMESVGTYHEPYEWIKM
jgi:hypothetical protein